MICHADVKGLEVVAAAYLSKDKVLYEELLNNVDIHADNQNKFELPSRLIAKVFKFRLLYGGTEYGFSRDPDFFEVSRDPKFWRNVIEKYYEKYKGIHDWHTKLLQQCNSSNGILRMPQGREYEFKKVFQRGEYVWPRSAILNYPVQGFGADLVAIGRVILRNRIRSFPGALLQSTVHDSIDIDTSKEACYTICSIMNNSIEDIPEYYEHIFGDKFDLPIKAEVYYGPSLGDLTQFKEGN